MRQCCPFCRFGIAVLVIGLLSLPLFASHRDQREFPAEWYWDNDKALADAHIALEGKPMPPLSVSDWKNGEVTAADMKGKVVVVDLFATWCGPCIGAIPHNNEMMEKYKDKGLVLIGVCTNRRGQEKMEEVVTSKGIKYPTARDPDCKTEKAWGVKYYPTYAVVDRKGVVRAVGLQTDFVERVVEKLLAEKAE